jgi:pyridinium-3,5-biscarboxylic acid mononucleotide sulfurtransferase
MQRSTLNEEGIAADVTRLRDNIRQHESALIAYSGGVDSALVMAVAHDVLGSRAIACIGVSPSYPQRELENAISVAQSLGARYQLVQTEELLNADYTANPANRCYFCKTELYDRLAKLAVEMGVPAILDGTNATDLTDNHRPGYQAAREHGVRSPLADVGLTKDQVRAAAKHIGLSVWDKPAMPCLSSRVPQGVTIVPGLLSRIERAEDALVALGFKQFRVRHHGDVARIELPAADLPRAIEHRETIVAAVRAAGYRFVALDLAGFQSGSLSNGTAADEP